MSTVRLPGHVLDQLADLADLIRVEAQMAGSSKMKQEVRDR